MADLTEQWLKDINEELRRRDVPPRQRPWLALEKWAKYTGMPLALDDDVVKTISAWFEKNTKAGSQQMGSLYIGAYCYDSSLWPVFIPICYGSVKFYPQDALKTMPESVVEGLFRDLNKAGEYVSVWADCFDYAFGLDDLKKIDGFGPFTRELLNSGDQQLRATVALMFQDRPSPKAMESGRMSTEIFLKAFLAAYDGLTENDAKRKFGHHIEKALDRCLIVDIKSEPERHSTLYRHLSRCRR